MAFTQLEVSTHSRPKAAGEVFNEVGNLIVVSTHSRPKAAGTVGRAKTLFQTFQHTAARRRLECLILRSEMEMEFQHTAARRRLATLTA